MAAAIWSQKDMRSPSGGKARRRGGTHIGKAPPSPKMSIFGLTRGQVFGEDQVATLIIPRLCRTLRPAPQAGCFVSRLYVSKDSAQITLRHGAFRTVALAPSSTVLRDLQQFWPEPLLGNMKAQCCQRRAEHLGEVFRSICA